MHNSNDYYLLFIFKKIRKIISNINNFLLYEMYLFSLRAHPYCKYKYVYFNYDCLSYIQNLCDSNTLYYSNYLIYY